MITYYVLFSRLGNFAWVFSYGFVVCAALRLARYNTNATGEHKTSFNGLPSTAAGMTLASYYAFSQTDLYREQLAQLPWNQLLIFLTIALSIAMVSNIKYARLPRISLRSARGLMGLAINLTILIFSIVAPDLFFFMFGIAYVSYGVIRSALVAIGESAEARQQQRELVLHDSEGPTLTRRREPPAAEG